jgi:hypothetical protein
MALSKSTTGNPCRAATSRCAAPAVMLRAPAATHTTLSCQCARRALAEGGAVLARHSCVVCRSERCAKVSRESKVSPALHKPLRVEVEEQDRQRRLGGQQLLHHRLRADKRVVLKQVGEGGLHGGPVVEDYWLVVHTKLEDDLRVAGGAGGGSGAW